jgi:serine protease Do
VFLFWPRRRDCFLKKSDINCVEFKRKLKKIILTSIGLLALVVLFSGCQQQAEQDANKALQDSTKEKKIVIQEPEIPVREFEENHQQIELSRATAITKAVTKVSPAVVSVTAIKISQRRVYIDPFFQRFFPEYRSRIYQEKRPSLGSGFIVSADGYVVTNHHVVEDADEISINTSDGNEFPATLVGGDFVSDIALLKVDKQSFVPAEIGTSDDLYIGEWAIALGSPFGLFKNNKPTVTVGVVSAVDRDFGRVEGGRIYQDMIQTDASINSGNSGGPLVNALGQIIGMNTFIYTGDNYASGSVGIGFAIPIDRIVEIVNGLKDHTIDRDYWIGIAYLPLNKFLAKEMGYPNQEGIYVSRIMRGSPAIKAGVKLGDIIIEINGIPVTDTDTVERAMGSEYLKVGDTLNLKVWREGKVIPIKMVLEKRNS